MLLKIDYENKVVSRVDMMIESRIGCLVYIYMLDALVDS